MMCHRIYDSARRANYPKGNNLAYNISLPGKHEVQLFISYISLRAGSSLANARAAIEEESSPDSSPLFAACTTEWLKGELAWSQARYL